jgi:hypothetical protein
MNFKAFSEADDKKKTWLFNYIKTIYPEADEFNFIEKYKKKLMNIIEKNEKWGNSSKEGLFFLIGKQLRENGDDKYSKMYSEMGYKYLKKIREIENENKQTEKEKLYYRNHEFFIDILDNINYDEIQTLNGHYQYLLLSLLTLQPPVRTGFYSTAQFIKSNKENDRKNNFIRIDRKGKLKIYYIINNDKVSKTKVYSTNKELSKIKIEDEKLVNLINNSYIKYPRKYLFEIKNKPASQVTLLSFLKKITKLDGINNDMLRSSYINFFYKIHNSLKARESLALKMRHSVITSLRNYHKVHEEPLEKALEEIKDNSTDEKKDDSTDEPPDEKTYGKINNPKFKKLKRDVLYNLNKGSKPRESTLNKYNITYNTITKQYE